MVVFSLLRMRELPRNGGSAETFAQKKTEDTMDSREFNRVLTLDHELYRSIYDAYHSRVGMRGSVNQNHTSLSTRNETKRLDLASYGEDIMNKGCELTVLIMDPSISSSLDLVPQSILHLNL